ncbi:hypothetical protein [Chloroflexus sp. Y-396-1]|uniref:hypothetical protein n=1 Tax=Chloroflexus sp. Y-396-1 TaxID=867845 RepID=UPI00048A9F49|nr:hypothetical protein [Chloroflexus sp. Y-396-1]
MSDILGALGQAWPRLLLYPGGISALLMVLIVARLRGIPPATLEPFTLIDLLPPLSVITLLPLTPAAPFAYGLDVPTALLMLLWPSFRRAARERIAPQQMLEWYLPLLIAATALVSVTTTLDLSGLLRWPAEPLRQLCFLLGTLAWIAAVPPITSLQNDLAGACSEVGLLLIGVLPLIAGLSTLPIINQIPPLILVPATLIVAVIAAGSTRHLSLPSRYLLAGMALLVSGFPVR